MRSLGPGVFSLFVAVKFIVFQHHCPVNDPQNDPLSLLEKNERLQQQLKQQVRKRRRNKDHDCCEEEGRGKQQKRQKHFHPSLETKGITRRKA